MAAKNTSPPKSKLYPPTHTIPHGAQPDNTRLSLWRLWKHHGFQPHSAGFSNLHAQTGILVEARAEGSIAKAFAASPELSQPREREEPVLQRPSEQTYQLESQLSKRRNVCTCRLRSMYLDISNCGSPLGMHLPPPSCLCVATTALYKADNPHWQWCSFIFRYQLSFLTNIKKNALSLSYPVGACPPGRRYGASFA